MRLYELIRRLEAIRDRMESTFTNEFLKGEADNLIDELKLLSPEIGKVVDSKSDEELLKKFKENYPGGGTANPSTGGGTANPSIIPTVAIPSGTIVANPVIVTNPVWWTSSNNITITSDASSVNWSFYTS